MVTGHALCFACNSANVSHAGGADLDCRVILGDVDDLRSLFAFLELAADLQPDESGTTEHVLCYLMPHVRLNTSLSQALNLHCFLNWLLSAKYVLVSYVPISSPMRIAFSSNLLAEVVGYTE